jgi:carbonic anhydrase
VPGTFADELAGNERFARAFALEGVPGRPAKGLAIVTCMDARIEPLSVLGLEVGDAIVIRNGGGRVTDDVVRSLVAARWLLGVTRAMVVAHARCGLTAASDAELHAAMREVGAPEAAVVSLLASPDPAATVRADVERLRTSAELAGLDVAGFVYDVDTGRLAAA